MSDNAPNFNSDLNHSSSNTQKNDCAQSAVGLHNFSVQATLVELFLL